MTRGATWATCPHYKYPKKNLKLSFWSQPNRKRESKREREREREKQSSLFDSRDFVGRILLGRELKLIYATRTTCGYQNHKILPRSKVRVFTKTKKGGVPRKHAI